MQINGHQWVVEHEKPRDITLLHCIRFNEISAVNEDDKGSAQIDDDLNQFLARLSNLCGVEIGFRPSW